MKEVPKLTEVYQGNTFVGAVAAALATKGLITGIHKTITTNLYEPGY